MRQGRPAEEIIKAVEQHQCDLILIGSHGEGGARRVTMGQTGNEVVVSAGASDCGEIAKRGRVMAEQPIIFYHKAT